MRCDERMLLIWGIGQHLLKRQKARGWFPRAFCFASRIPLLRNPAFSLAAKMLIFLSLP